MNPEAAEFHPSVLALVPAPLVLARIPIPVARKQQRRRRKKKKNLPDANARRPKPRATNAPARKSRNAKPPPPPEPVWPRAPPPPARQRSPSPPPPAPLRVQIARPSDTARARWRVAADAWREDRDAALASDQALAKMRATAIARAGAAARAAAAVARARGDDSSDDDDLSATSSDTSVEAPPPDTSAAALAAHCAHGRVAALRLALRASRDAVNGRDRRGRTPLHAAAARGHTGCVQALLSAGADVYPRDRQLETPLHACASTARGRAAVECVRALCHATPGKGRSAVDAKSKRDGRTALHYAVERAVKQGASTSIVRALVAGGASPLVCDAHGRSALAAAAGGGRATLVRELLGGARRGAHCPGKLVVGPLQEAARAGDAKTLAELCGARLFDIDAREVSGERDTALTAAARRASADCVRVLLAHGADPLREDGRRRSPVAACVDGASVDRSKTLELLVAAARDRDAVRRGPDFFERPLCGAAPRPPLAHALRRGEVSLAATLIDCGAPGPRVLKDIGKLPDDVLRHVAAFLPDEGPARHLAVGLRRRDPPRPRRFSSSLRRGAAAFAVVVI